MIYISTSCVKNSLITESVEELAKNGFKNLELSGGTQFYDYKTIVEDLLILKEKYGLNYLLHNYFPPPKKDFVLNLASIDDEINQLSYSHIIESIDMSSKLSAKYFGFHAGFFLDISTSEIGKKITSKPYTNTEQEEAKQRFYDNYKKINSYASKKDISLFIENNVYSSSNYDTYGDTNPLMLMTKEDFEEMKQEISFNLLLDFAHLKVSCNTLNKDFSNEVDYLNSNSTYIHLSDNNSLEDSNRFISKDSDLFNQLMSLDIKNKVITLEIYESVEKIKESYHLIESLL